MELTDKHRSPLKAIRAKCLDCCCGDSKEVRLCPTEHCALHPYRMGKNPYRKPRELTDEQRAALSERMSKARQASKRVEG